MLPIRREGLAEHERAVLKLDIREHGLKAGDVGTIVQVYEQGKAYEIEFVSLNGKTLAVATTEQQQVRPRSAHAVFRSPLKATVDGLKWDRRCWLN